MPMPRALIAAAALVATVAGCARIQKPVLYPNARLREVGPARAERDIEECRHLAAQHVRGTAGRDIGREAAVGGVTAGAAGAAGGAVHGAMSGRGAGPGAAIGAATGAAAGAAAGAVRGAVRQTEPSPVYKSFVNRCLKERGYDVVGWQ
jgi:hypothetical protein